MEMKSPLHGPTPYTVTVRRNPHRRARPTPSSAVPLPLPLCTSSSKHNISSFPIQDILSIDVSENENPKQIVDSPTEGLISDNLKVFLRIRPVVIQQRSGTSTKNGAYVSRGKNVWPQNPNTKNAATKTKATKKKKSETCLKVNDSRSVTLCPPQNLQDQRRIKSEVYEGFSHVFCADSSQNEVYERMVNPLVEDFLKGKSGMLAALGASGSGKTHTVFGCTREPGMVPLALRRIFSETENNGAKQSRTLYLSMFEIYSERGKGEKIIDLSQDGGDLSMQQSIIKGLQEAVIQDAQQAQSLIACGLLKRATAMTNSNNQSSRSQCIINIRSGPNKIDEEVDAKSHTALLTIVDLAGAEREKRTGNQGVRLLESNFINNTSMVFGLCLRSLLEHQKNPKKPLQKHFQSSLLTRYLRDYMDGKKRMTLILTAKSGDEDYPETSFLLRQASPYMNIKFENVEEPPFNTFGMKRHSQALPIADQLKRMKFSNVEARLVSGGKDAESCQRHKEEVTPEQVKKVQSKEILVRSPNINIEVNDNASHKQDVIDLAKRERESQIMLNFSKALWNVLKQYKSELEVAKNEVDSLRESLVVEKERRSMLENELNDIKSCCSCGKEVEAMVYLVEGSGSRANGFSELEGCQDTGVHQVNTIVSSSNHNGSECLETEISVMQTGKEISDATVRQTEKEISDAAIRMTEREISDATARQTEREISDATVWLTEKEISNAAVTSSISVNSSCVGMETLDDKNYQVKAQVSSPNLNDSEYVDNKQISDATVASSFEVTSSCPGVVTGYELSHSVVSCLQSLVIVSDDSSSPVEGGQLQHEEEEKLLDQPLMPTEDVSSSQRCNTTKVPEVKGSLPPCQSLNPGKPKRRLQPASSILLRNIDGLEVNDENESPKGPRGEKKLTTGVTKRTQGSIDLLRILKDL